MNKNAKYGILLAGVVSLMMLSVLVLSGSQDNTKLVNNEKNSDYKGSAYISSGSIVELNDKELFNNSDTIVMGSVKEILPSKYGNRISKNTDFGPDHVIYTDITISVDKYIKNSLSSKEVIVRVAGGKVGDDSLVMEDEPSVASLL